MNCIHENNLQLYALMHLLAFMVNFFKWNINK